MRALLLLPLALVYSAAVAQAPAKAPDVLVFVNGEQLTGELERANTDGVTFKSAMAGEITVKWANIKDLTSSKSFAVITKNEKLTRKDAAGLVPDGTIHVADGKISVAAASGEKDVPVADTSLVIDAGAFDKAIHHQPGLARGWGGTATAGASLVRSTQNSTNFNGAINLVRSTPNVDWLPPHDKTILDYNQAYGTVSQTGTATVKTNIFHADAERDEYFSPRLFAFASATFDHNYASSLDLEQAYGGGVGISLLHNAHRQLDLKADAHYEKETFFDSPLNLTATTQNQNLFGSTFSEKYLHYLFKGLVLNEFGSVSPAWHQSNSSPTQPNALSAHVNASLGFPVYKGIGFNVGAVDDYINNAPAGSKQNSTQFTTGLTYTIKPR